MTRRDDGSESPRLRAREGMRKWDAAAQSPAWRARGNAGEWLKRVDVNKNANSSAFNDGDMIKSSKKTVVVILREECPGPSEFLR